MGATTVLKIESKCQALALLSFSVGKGLPWVRATNWLDAPLVANGRWVYGQRTFSQ